MGWKANSRAMGEAPRLTLTAVDTVALDIPNGYDSFYVSGSSVTVPSLSASFRPGRIIALWGASGAASITFTDTGIASAAEGLMILNGSISSFGSSSVLFLKQHPDGSWRDVNMRVLLPG